MNTLPIRILALIAVLAVATGAATLADDPEGAPMSEPATVESNEADGSTDGGAEEASNEAPADSDQPEPDQPQPAEPEPETPETEPAEPQSADPEPAEPEAPGQELVNPQPGFLANVAVDHADGEYRQGDKLKVRFKVERDAHVYLLYHQADETAVLLFPNQAHPSNLLKGNEEVTIPGPGEPFRFRVSPPFGDEALQVVASTEPIAELDALDTASGRAPQVPAELIKSLGERIAKDPSAFGEHRVTIKTLEREAPAEPPRKPERFALVVGVNRYDNPELASEEDEAKLSAVKMAEAFEKRCGVPAKNIRVITDEHTTRANIEEAFTRWLPSVTRPGDTVFFFYVGHGHQVASRDRRRSDAMESFLTVYDIDPPKVNSHEEYEEFLRGRMILESTMARWLQELPGRQIVLLIEACRSGSFAEAKGVAPQWSYFVQEGARVKGISQLGTLVITACAADENDRFTQGQVSWMPHFLFEAMDKFPAPLTVRQAFDYYRDGLKKRLAGAGAAGQQLPVMVDNLLLPVPLVPQGE